MNISSTFDDLPSELIDKIFTHLDYKDLKNCKLVNKRFYALAKEDAHWKRLCKEYWLETSCSAGQTWENYFIQMYKDLGLYISCYAALKRSWQKIEQFLSTNCPILFETINSGATEAQLNFAEEVLGAKLPLDLRCSYRIHNGQRLTSPGIIGSMNCHGHYKSESLLDIETIIVATGTRLWEGLKGCIPLTLCLNSGLTQYLVVSDVDGYDINTIFYPISRSQCLIDVITDAFITGTSFQEWLTTFANHLANNDYVIIQDQPFRFLHDPSAEETTGPITVSVSTCFIPEFSKITPPVFTHAYRITMSMSADVPRSESCQLETRHWTITDENGSEEQVDGPGVVGEYPVMFPGASFSWISTTNFNTTYGNMKGYFRMRNLQTSDRIEVACPVFHMKCDPYITYEERRVAKRKKMALSS